MQPAHRQAPSGRRTPTNAWSSATHERPHEALGQRVPGRIYGPASAMPEQLPKVNYPRAWDTRRVRTVDTSNGEGESVLSDEPLSAIGGTEKIADGIHEVSRSHLIGLLYDQDLAGMRPVHCPSSLRLSACPPLGQSGRLGGARLNKRRLRRPAIWLVCSGARQAALLQKCHPCH